MKAIVKYKNGCKEEISGKTIIGILISIIASNVSIDKITSIKLQ